MMINNSHETPPSFFLYFFSYSYNALQDFIDDYVDPTLRITNPITSIQEGLNYQFQAQFFDESGTKVENLI